MATSNKRRNFSRTWSRHIFALYESGDYSDLKIKCKDRTFNVHKAIVCPQSPVLAAAVNGKFQESENNIVEIKDYDVEVVEVMILFMYGKTTGVLEDPVKYCESKTPAKTAEVAQPEATLEEHATDTSNSENVDGTTVTATAPNATYTSHWAENDSTWNDLADPVITTTTTTTSDDPWGPTTTATTTTATTTTTTATAKPNPYATLNDEQALETLLGLIAINSVADYYDVLGLRICTQYEIRWLLNTLWSPDNFLAAAKAVSSSTGDTALHHILIKLAAKNMGSLVPHGDDFEGLTSLKDFGPKLMEYTHDRMETMSEKLELLDLFAGNMISEFKRPFYRNYRHATVAEIVDKMEEKRNKLNRKI